MPYQSSSTAPSGSQPNESGGVQGGGTAPSAKDTTPNQTDPDQKFIVTNWAGSVLQSPSQSISESELTMPYPYETMPGMSTPTKPVSGPSGNTTPTTQPTQNQTNPGMTMTTPAGNGTDGKSMQPQQPTTSQQPSSDYFDHKKAIQFAEKYLLPPHSGPKIDTRSYGLSSQPTTSQQPSSDYFDPARNETMGSDRGFYNEDYVNQQIVTKMTGAIGAQPNAQGADTKGIQTRSEMEDEFRKYNDPSFQNQPNVNTIQPNEPGGIYGGGNTPSAKTPNQTDPYHIVTRQAIH